ncbi:MAG: glycosyltransferase family 4 protein [Armatimonadetes bacterium]|nr:glycosyltransferase family 4 protein [Armatimonadota bacterium]
MRIAFMGVKGLPSRGGAERVVEAIATRMSRFGIQAVVYCDSRYTPRGTVIDGVELIRVPSLPGKHLRQISINVFAALHALFCGRYNLIHMHNVEASFILPILRIRYRVVGTCHGLAYWRTKWGPVAKFVMRMMDLPFVRMCNVVTCVSNKDIKNFRTRFRRECVFVPVGVNLGFQPNMTEARLIESQYGLKPGEYLLFAAGRIDPTKGAHLAIEAVKRVAQDVPLLIVGDDSHSPQYSKALRDSASANVHFHPLIEDPEVLLGVMADAGCLVFPSFMEAMSSVLLEASSVGLPILCSDIPENVAVMQDDAIYFKTENVESLAEQLKWTLENRDAVSLMGRRAQERIRTHCNWDTIVAQYAEIYKRATSPIRESTKT